MSKLREITIDGWVWLYLELGTRLIRIKRLHRQGECRRPGGAQ